MIAMLAAMDTFPDLGSLSDQELKDLIQQLTEEEVDISYKRRILHGTADGRLFSLDAATGKLDPSFGEGGIRDLRKELDEKTRPLAYGPTSAPRLCSRGFGRGRPS